MPKKVSSITCTKKECGGKLMRTNKSETVVVPPEFHSNTEYGAQ